MSASRSPSPIAELSKRLKCKWAAITAAKDNARKKRAELKKLFKDQRFDSEDLSIVTFGSLAREEWTSGSDVDWTLLVDGFAASEHLQIAHAIRDALREGKFIQPGPTGIFGHMAFSHDIIHNIGLQQDTNENTTRRILLLLESVPAGANEAAYDRVVAGVLNRYLEEETSFLTASGQRRNVPRFLLNDIVRFWRTMAVDFASKQRERAGEGWALRNIKLRMSRKLIFCSGLLMCFSCYRDPSEETGPDEAMSTLDLVEHLKSYVALTPLEILAKSLVTYKEEKATSKAAFDAYDRFLALIDDQEKRTTLQEVKSSEAQSNDVFNEAREMSHEFEESLMHFFFDNENLKPLTRKYGVF